jgi:hypothetical protein
MNFTMPKTVRRSAITLIVIGVTGLLTGIVFAPDAVAVHLLLTGFFGVGLGLAGALFVAMQYVTGATWSAPLRRVPEAMIALLPVGGALLLLALIAYPSLYPWTNHDVHLHGELKHAWLQRPFFLFRAAGYLILWTCLAVAMVRTSRRQDCDATSRSTLANRRWSALSREPNWVSTVYGLYNFAGLFTSGWAVFILLVLWLRQLGPFRDVVTPNRLHDLGKLLFGMCVFWLYLWYCQYMLIWFVNNPEETPHYIRRLEGYWETLFYLNVAVNGVIPFFVLLPRSIKQNPKALVNVCVVVLLGRWLDLYLMIFPEEHGFLAALVAGAMTLGAAGLYLLVFGWSIRQAALIPRSDPLLTENSVPHPHAPALVGGGRR